MKPFLHFLRLWEIIELADATRTRNIARIADCRLRISKLDQRLDHLTIKAL